MKTKSNKLCNLFFNGIRFEIINITDDHGLISEYKLMMRWREADDNNWIHNKSRQLGKYNYLSDAMDRVAEIVKINS